MCARDGRGGDRNLFVRKKALVKKRLGKTVLVQSVCQLCFYGNNDCETKFRF